MQEGDPFKKGTIAMTLLNLEYVAALPDSEPRKKGLLARAYSALHRSRMAYAENLLRQYRPLLDSVEAQGFATRTNPFTID
ncbi:MAG: hypothetical protein JNM23_07700 [Bradyrhizobiaceae bacterium]|nr:hypothetical protein [Bradyrhizobiaceae bacterium]